MQLSTLCGWDGQAWHLHFGRMCEGREADLWPAPGSKARAASFYCGILCDFDAAGATFSLKPEVIEAFALLGIRPCGAEVAAE
jgi:hypothetical protein